MPIHPEQGAFPLNDKPKPDTSHDPDTLEGVGRTIAGGRRGVRPNPTEPLFKGAVELQEEPEKKVVPPYTHTVPMGREVWCLDGDPGAGRYATRTMGTLHLAKRDDTYLINGMRGRKRGYTATKEFTTFDRAGNRIDHSAGIIVVTPYAKARKPIGMRQPPSTPLEQR